MINCWFFKLPLSHLSWETLYSVPSSCFRHFLTIFTKVNMLLSIKFNWNWWNKKNPTGTNTSFLRELWWVKCQLEMPWFLLSIVLGHFFNVINFGKFFFLKGESVWYLIYYLLLNIIYILYHKVFMIIIWLIQRAAKCLDKIIVVFLGGGGWGGDNIWTSFNKAPS